MNELNFETNKKMKFFYQNSLISLTSLVFIGLIIRIIYTDFEIPLALDALEYFIYAIDVSRLGHLPESYTPSNNGWSIFLSIVFSIFQFDNGLNYMQLQKLSSIIFSSLTIIPIYYLIKQFFEKKYAVLGVIIFVFEPRIIINSVLGVADPLYIFLISVSLVLVLKKQFAFVSFAIVAKAAMARPEGLFLFAGLFIMYILKYRNQGKIIPKCSLAIFIFILILSPMMMYKMSIFDDDRIFGRAAETIEFHSKPIEETNGNSGIPFIVKGLETFPKYLGWSMIPIFIILVPIGTIILFKEWQKINFMIITPIITMSIPMFYVYSIPLLETRYTYFVFPLFCVISVFTIKKIVEKNRFQNIIILGITTGIIILSLVFVEYQKIDYESEKDGIEISEFIFQNANAVNPYENNKFIKSTQILSEWPVLPEVFFDGHIKSPILKISIDNSKSLKNFIMNAKSEKLTHIVANSEDSNKEFKQIFYNEEEYAFLEKKHEINNKNHIKIFEINYNELEK